MLEFLRYEEVTLPKGMSREMLIKDLDFFGIQLENEDKVESKASDVSHTNINQVTVVQELFKLASALLSEIRENHSLGLADAEYFSIHVKATKNIATMDQLTNSSFYHGVLNEILAPVGFNIETIHPTRTVTRERLTLIYNRVNLKVL